MNGQTTAMSSSIAARSSKEQGRAATTKARSTIEEHWVAGMIVQVDAIRISYNNCNEVIISKHKPADNNHAVYTLAGVLQLYRSTEFSAAMTTDPSMMADAEMLQQSPAVDLLWIVASICFLVVFSLFVVLIVVFARFYRSIVLSLYRLFVYKSWHVRTQATDKIIRRAYSIIIHKI